MNSVGNLSGVELGKMDTEGLRSMQDKCCAALRARGEHSAGDAKRIEQTLGGKDDIRRFDETIKEMAEDDKSAAQTNSAKCEDACKGYLVVSLQTSGGPLHKSDLGARKGAENTLRGALQNYDSIRKHPTAQSSTPPPSTITARHKTRPTTPNSPKTMPATAQETIAHLMPEVDKHKLNL